ncbi:hypothetical protein Tco_1243716, partial [Tanacetum coccineum]
MKMEILLEPTSNKLMVAFIGGLPRSIEGNVTASKPQTLEEAINISQRLMDQNRMAILTLRRPGSSIKIDLVTEIDHAAQKDKGKVNPYHLADQKVAPVASTRYEVLYTSVPGDVHVSTRYCSGGGWTNQMVTRGTGVCQSEVLWQSVRGRRVPIMGNNEE